MPAARATHPARRSDAGTIKLTDRDITGLTLVADQYGAPVDLLALALGVQPERLRGILARWRHAGWADTGSLGKGHPGVGSPPPGCACSAFLTRRRIRADYTTLDTEHQALTAQLGTLAADAAPGTDIDLVSLLPEITTALAELPEDLQAALYAIFDIQIMWNAPVRQATFHATITDTTPQLIQALLNRANDDDHTPATGPAGSPATSTNTSPTPVEGSVRSAIC